MPEEPTPSGTTEELLRVISEFALDAIVMMDGDGRVAYWNEAAKRIFGYDTEEILGRSLHKCLAPERFRGQYEAGLDHFFRTGTGGAAGVVVEMVGLRKGGEEFPIELAVSPIRRGDAFWAAAIVRDISERKQAEQRLREQEDLTRRILGASTVGLAQTAGRKIVWANEEMERLFGMTVDQYRGQDTRILYPNDEEYERVGRTAYEQARIGKPVQTEATFQRADGSTFAGYVKMDLLDPSNPERGMITSVTDISALRRAEQEREALEEQLRQSMKMEAIGRLAGGVAHDFNNLLTAINGYAELVFDSLEDGDPLRLDVDEIRRAGERAAGLTRQLLAFSRKQILSIKVIDPNEVVGQSHKMLRRIIGEDVELRYSPAADLWRIKADPTQLDQILVNLSVNARDAMPSGGRLTIATSNVSLDGMAIVVDGEPMSVSGDYVLLTVSDTGVGMDEETKSRVFEPYFSTKSQEQSAGLGLATVYGITRQNGGFITLSSKLGEGTTFELYFPRVEDDPDEPVLPAVESLPRGDETILLVEDEETVRHLAGKILRRLGYRVLEADGADVALPTSERHEGRIHLLLTDVIMPKMNGRELYLRVREQRPEIAVLYMSGYTDEVIAPHGVLEDDTNFIGKPFHSEDLARKVREALDRLPRVQQQA